MTIIDIVLLCIEKLSVKQQFLRIIYHEFQTEINQTFWEGKYILALFQEFYVAY